MNSRRILPKIPVGAGGGNTGYTDHLRIKGSYKKNSEAEATDLKGVMRKGRVRDHSQGEESS